LIPVLIALILILDLAAFLFLAAYQRLSSSQIFRLKEIEESHRAKLSNFIEKRDFYVSGFNLAAVIFIAATQLLFGAAARPEKELIFPMLLLGLSALTLFYIVASLFAARNPEKIFLLFLPFMKIVCFILFPLVFPVSLLINAFKSEPQDDEETREEEIEAFLDEGRREGILEKEESELIRGIMEFSETVVREVMTPRIDVVTIEASATLEEALNLFAKCRHTRAPVYENQIDNIVGVIWVKDILAPAISKDKERKVKEFLRPVSFVPENKRISDLLKEFQSQREQMAIIVDEYGGVDGLVTTEDLVEEIVGEIEERGEAEGEFIKALQDGAYEARGRASLKDLSDKMGVELTEGDYDSIAGWIATRLGTIPSSGQTFELDGLKVDIVSADRKRIHRVKISKIGKISEKP
jgi:putative hemolysin